MQEEFFFLKTGIGITLSIAAGGEFNECPARNYSSINVLKDDARTFAWLYSSDGTVTDSEL
jgi:hypothetical protein